MKSIQDAFKLCGPTLCKVAVIAGGIAALKYGIISPDSWAGSFVALTTGLAALTLIPRRRGARYASELSNG
jgi:hypothetical protein